MQFMSFLSIFICFSSCADTIQLVKEKAESEEGKKMIETIKEKAQDKETQEKLKGFLGNKKEKKNPILPTQQP
ncbi:MAG: hypothetical protein N3A69_04060 [Leptospiraceae bacterium]|nr:hypothetical protein [Leptospiraceae bacterium]